ncbi:MAG: hypothetical protein ABIH23_11540 [bacterium]
MLTIEQLDKLVLSSDNLSQLQVHYLEAMYGLNEINLERFLLKDSTDYTALDKLREREKEIIAIAVEIQKRIKYVRMVIWKTYEGDDNVKKYMDDKATAEPTWWINNFVWTHDPRLLQYGMNPLIPLVLFPKQQEFLLWLDDNYRGKNRSSQPMLVEKSRGWGVTECCCSYDVNLWRYSPGYKVTWGSRTVDLVDTLKNPDTIFARLRRIIYNLPKRMRPTGYDAQSNQFDLHLRIINPDNDSVIVGEGGDNMGAGGRSSAYRIDEKSLVEHQDLVDAAVSYNTNSQLDIGTPNPTGMDSFYKKRMSKNVKIFTCWWYHDPSKTLKWAENRPDDDSAWYKHEELTRDPQLLASQVNINYTSSITDPFIKGEWVDAAVGFDLLPEGAKTAGYDIAAGGKNKSVYISRHGPVVNNPVVLGSDSIITAFWQAIDKAEEDGVSVFNYDLAGIGKSAHDLAKQAGRRFKFKVNGILGNATAGDSLISSEGRRMKEKFRNLRAVIWWEMRERFRKTYEHKKGIRFYATDELISIPNDHTLRTQLAMIRQKPSPSGKIGLESKDDLKGRNIESPDHADALAYCLAMTDPGAVIDNFTYTAQSEHVKKLNINWDREACPVYVSMIMTKRLEYYVICALWNPRSYLLRVFREMEFGNLPPEDISVNVKEACHEGLAEIKEWIGNREMFDFNENAVTSAQSPYFVFRRAGVHLRRNYSNHERGSLIALNRMFERNNIEIHEDCSGLIFQLTNWNIRAGAPQEDYTYAAALAQLVTRLKATHEIPESYTVKEYGQEFATSNGVRKRVK